MKLGIWIIGALLLATQAIAQSGVRVVDGDTLQIGQTTYRLFGIDAPEHGQKCMTRGGGSWSCGKEATEYLQKLVLAGSVQCDDRGQDRYGRTIAICRTGGKDVNEQMVSSGHAWAFLRYSREYEAAEGTARGQGIGIWQAQTQPAWDYRADKWARAEDQAPNGCPIKGNISKSGMIYHTPWSPFYTRTKINTAKGERWFCSEDEAKAAGWRAPRWGG